MAPRPRVQMRWKKARCLLKQGHSVGIFPEGQFSPQNGRLQEPRAGVACLALLTDTPVIPIRIYLPRELGFKFNTPHTEKPARFWCLRDPYGVTVGKPNWINGETESMGQVNIVEENIMK